MLLHLKRKIRQSLLSLFYRNLWARLALILFVIVTIPLVALGALLINTSHKAVRSSVLNNHKQIVARAAQEIEIFIKRPRDVLFTAAAMLEVVYPAPWKQETILVEIVLNQPIFIRVVSVDLSGNEVASSELGRGLSWDYPREALAGVWKNKSYISEVKFLGNHTPLVTIAVPIKKMGKLTGALIADVNLRGLWEMVDSITLGETGRAFLVSDAGTIIAHQDKKKVLQNQNLKDREEVALVLKGREGAIELRDETEGKLISSFAPIRGLGWGLVLRQKQDEAYRFSRVMKTQSWIIIILSELLAVLASIFMGKKLVAPIKNLSFGIRSAADGDLDYKVIPGMRDDIGELFRSFNSMAKKLKTARDRERLSVIGEATAWITHELKNSLVSIKSFVQLLPGRYRDERFRDKFSRLVPGEINRMERMFKELSDFSAHLNLSKTRTDLKEIIDNTLEIMREELINKKINLNYSRQNDNFPIEADPERLKQVFMNLIINSINAMPQGGALVVTIEKTGSLQAKDIPEGVEVRIKDTGKGISGELLRTLFLPFQTTKDAGLGLGLTISRKIVEQHGGNIDVESEIGRGTTFIVRLPCSKVE